MVEHSFPLSSFEEVYQAFRVLILDLDGTLTNGPTPVPGVAESTFRLMTDPTKKVLFFTNGGYANLNHTWSKVRDWLQRELSQ